MYMTDFVINSTLIIVTHVVVTKTVEKNNNNQPQIIQCLRHWDIIS